MSVIINVLIIDVEDYFQVFVFVFCIFCSEWEICECCVECNVGLIFDMFDWYDVKVMFFMFGWIVECYLELVCEMVWCGYEVVSYGYGYQCVSD